MAKKIEDRSCQSNFDRQFWFFLSYLIITGKVGYQMNQIGNVSYLSGKM